MCFSSKQEQTNEVELDKDIDKASRDQLRRALQAAALPYQPNRGAQFAAFTPMQVQAMHNQQGANAAFGMPSTANPLAGMPNAITSGGIKGYGTGEVYDDMMARADPEWVAGIKALQESFKADADKLRNEDSGDTYSGNSFRDEAINEMFAQGNGIFGATADKKLTDMMKGRK